MGFWQIVDVLNARKWLIVATCVVTLLLTYGATKMIGSRWVATVDFIQPMPTPASTDASATPASDEDAHNTALQFAQMIRSQAVIEPVLQTVDKTQSPQDLLDEIDFNATSPRLYQLQVTERDPARATMIANALGEQFVKVNHDINTQQAARAVDLLTGQLKAVDADLSLARARYDSYRAKHDIVGNLNGSVDVALTEWRQAVQKRDAAEADLSDAAARLRSLQVVKAQIPVLSQTDAIAGSPLAQQQQDLTKADDDLTQLRAKYTDAMPKVQAAIATRNAIAKRLQAEWTRDGGQITNRENASLQSIEGEMRDLEQLQAGKQAEVDALNKNVEATRAELDSFKGLDMPLTVLAGNMAEKTDLRQSLGQRLATARQALDIAERQSPLTMMDHVNTFNPPINTSGGRAKKLLALALLASLLAVCSLIIAFESVDTRIKTVRRAEQLLPCKLLAVIPQPKPAISTIQMARSTELLPHSVAAEAYRFLGLHLLNSSVQQTRSIMAISTKEKQGSTAVLCNLAITLAQAGNRVILVDSNVRHPRVHEIFGGKNDFGFADLAQAPTQDALTRALHKSAVDGLQYIPSGAGPDNPWQLFRSESLYRLSDLLRQAADYVLFDSPSSIAYTDALNLAAIVDSAILCVRAFEPITGAEGRVIKQLESMSVSVPGCVLSDIPATKLESYSNYESLAAANPGPSIITNLYQFPGPPFEASAEIPHPASSLKPMRTENE